MYSKYPIVLNLIFRVGQHSPLCGESNTPASARVGGSVRRVGRFYFEKA